MTITKVSYKYVKLLPLQRQTSSWFLNTIFIIFRIIIYFIGWFIEKETMIHKSHTYYHLEFLDAPKIERMREHK